MRRVIRKTIRRKEDGLDLAIDFNADVVINVSGPGRPQEGAPTEAESPESDDPASPEGNDPGGKDA